MTRMMILILTLASAPMTLASASPTGLWLTGKKGVIVNLYDCGGALCGRTVWMKKMFHKDGAPRIDTENPDPALRDRSWCGIEVITGLRPDGDGVWKDGEVYDPKTGRTFDFDLREKGERLKVRGYLGVPFLGKKETWVRADGMDVAYCTDL